jgi:hypothetical protein
MAMFPDTHVFCKRLVAHEAFRHVRENKINVCGKIVLLLNPRERDEIGGPLRFHLQGNHVRQRGRLIFLQCVLFGIHGSSLFCDS